MSAYAPAPERPAPRDGARIPFIRLLRVELRKQVDTRAGLGLLIAIGVITAAVVASQLWLNAPEHLTWMAFVEGSSLGWMMLLPLIGILAVTGEWSQRSALTTFTLEPRRTRVHLAKLGSALLLGAGMFLATLAIAAVVNLIGMTAFDGSGSWALDADVLIGSIAYLVVYIAMGVGFGLLLLNTPIAIVAYLVLPTVMMFLGAFEGLQSVVRWVDVGSASLTLYEGDLTGAQWAHLATSTGLWVVLPLALGLVRTARREVA